MPDDLQVLISYKQLSDLLTSAANVENLSKAQKRLELQVAALRADIYKLMDIVRNFEK